jgi:HSP20 family protein
MANIVRWDDPFAGITSLHSQLDDMFNNFFTTMPTTQASQTMPAMDIYSEDDKQLVAEVHAPGFDKDDVEVNVHNGVLEIKGEKHEKEEDKKDKKRSYMVRESHASFYRRLALPDYADAEHVDAQFENGVLRVMIPFKELPKPKKIAISNGKKK